MDIGFCYNTDTILIMIIMALAMYIAIATVAMISDLYQLLLYYSYTVHIMQSLLIF